MRALSPNLLGPGDSWPPGAYRDRRYGGLPCMLSPAGSRHSGDPGWRYVLTRGEVATQLDAIHAKTSEVCAGLDASQLNWQPDGGRRWSIAQCLDHLAKTTLLYGRRIEEAIDAAPAGAERESAEPNLAGRC